VRPETDLDSRRGERKVSSPFLLFLRLRKNARNRLMTTRPRPGCRLRTTRGPRTTAEAAAASSVWSLPIACQIAAPAACSGRPGGGSRRGCGYRGPVASKSVTLRIGGGIAGRTSRSTFCPDLWSRPSTTTSWKKKRPRVGRECPVRRVPPRDPGFPAPQVLRSRVRGATPGAGVARRENPPAFD